MARVGIRISPSLSQDLRRYACDLDRLLPGNLIGVYLYGSLATGCYTPGISDIDLIAVTQAGIDEPVRQGIVELHRSANLPVDTTFVTTAQVNADVVPARVEFVIRRAKLFRVPDGMADFVLNRQHALDYGVAVTGPAVRDVFRPVPRACLDQALLSLMDMILLRAEGQGGDARAIATGVLMLCRILYAIVNKRWASKLGGVAWATQALDLQWRDLITFAADCYPSASAPAACPWTMKDLQGFAEYCHGFRKANSPAWRARSQDRSVQVDMLHGTIKTAVAAAREMT